MNILYILCSDLFSHDNKGPEHSQDEPHGFQGAVTAGRFGISIHIQNTNKPG